jgi:hypothetical protein
MMFAVPGQGAQKLTQAGGEDFWQGALPAVERHVDDIPDSIRASGRCDSLGQGADSVMVFSSGDEK